MHVINIFFHNVNANDSKFIIRLYQIVMQLSSLSITSNVAVVFNTPVDIF